MSMTSGVRADSGVMNGRLQGLADELNRIEGIARAILADLPTGPMRALSGRIQVAAGLATVLSAGRDLDLMRSPVREPVLLRIEADPTTVPSGRAEVEQEISQAWEPATAPEPEIEPAPRVIELTEASLTDPWPGGTMVRVCNRCHARRPFRPEKVDPGCPICRCPEFATYQVPEDGGHNRSGPPSWVSVRSGIVIDPPDQNEPEADGNAVPATPGPETPAGPGEAAAAVPSPAPAEQKADSEAKGRCVVCGAKVKPWDLHATDADGKLLCFTCGKSAEKEFEAQKQAEAKPAAKPEPTATEAATSKAKRGWNLIEVDPEGKTPERWLAQVLATGGDDARRFAEAVPELAALLPDRLAIRYGSGKFKDEVKAAGGRTARLVGGELWEVSSTLEFGQPGDTVDPNAPPTAGWESDPKLMPFDVTYWSPSGARSYVGRIMAENNGQARMNFGKLVGFDPSQSKGSLNAVIGWPTSQFDSVVAELGGVHPTDGEDLGTFQACFTPICKEIFGLDFAHVYGHTEDLRFEPVAKPEPEPTPADVATRDTDDRISKLFEDAAKAEDVEEVVHRGEDAAKVVQPQPAGNQGETVQVVHPGETEASGTTSAGDDDPLAGVWWDATLRTAGEPGDVWIARARHVFSPSIATILNRVLDLPRNVALLIEPADPAWDRLATETGQALIGDEVVRGILEREGHPPYEVVIRRDAAEIVADLPAPPGDPEEIEPIAPKLAEIKHGTHVQLSTGPEIYRVESVERDRELICCETHGGKMCKPASKVTNLQAVQVYPLPGRNRREIRHLDGFVQVGETIRRGRSVHDRHPSSYDPSSPSLEVVEAPALKPGSTPSDPTVDSRAPAGMMACDVTCQASGRERWVARLIDASAQAARGTIEAILAPEPGTPTLAVYVAQSRYDVDFKAAGGWADITVDEGDQSVRTVRGRIDWDAVYALGIATPDADDPEEDEATDSPSTVSQAPALGAGYQWWDIWLEHPIQEAWFARLPSQSAAAALIRFEDVIEAHPQGVAFKATVADDYGDFYVNQTTWTLPGETGPQFPFAKDPQSLNLVWAAKNYIDGGKPASTLANPPAPAPAPAPASVATPPAPAESKVIHPEPSAAHVDHVIRTAMLKPRGARQRWDFRRASGQCGRDLRAAVLYELFLELDHRKAPSDGFATGGGTATPYFRVLATDGPQPTREIQIEFPALLIRVRKLLEIPAASPEMPKEVWAITSRGNGRLIYVVDAPEDDMLAARTLMDPAHLVEGKDGYTTDCSRWKKKVPDDVEIRRLPAPARADKPAPTNPPKIGFEARPGWDWTDVFLVRPGDDLLTMIWIARVESQNVGQVDRLVEDEITGKLPEGYSFHQRVPSSEYDAEVRKGGFFGTPWRAVRWDLKRILAEFPAATPAAPTTGEPSPDPAEPTESATNPGRKAPIPTAKVDQLLSVLFMGIGGKVVDHMPEGEGCDDETLAAAIAEDLATAGSRAKPIAYCWQAEPNPGIWLETTKPEGRPFLAGQKLTDRVRQVLGIEFADGSKPAPKGKPGPKPRALATAEGGAL